MPATYEPIASVTLGTAAAEVEFTSIAGTYTDLVLVFMGMHAATNGTPIYLTFNGSATNYSDTILSGNGSAASSTRHSSGARIRLDNATGFNTTNPLVGHVSIMSYANTSVFKTCLAGIADPTFGVDRIVGLWRDTTAITSVKVTSNSGNLASGFTAALYGIKAA